MQIQCYVNPYPCVFGNQTKVGLAWVNMIQSMLS